jgi:hypothetical protein
VEVGDGPDRVADVLGEVMGLILTDPRALDDATPLRLYESLSRSSAEWLCRRLRAAGAAVELRVPRKRRPGLRRARPARSSSEPRQVPPVDRPSRAALVCGGVTAAGLALLVVALLMG